VKTLTAASCLAALFLLCVPAPAAQSADDKDVPLSVKGGVRSIDDPEPSELPEKPVEKPKVPWQGQLAVPGWVSQNRTESVHFTLMTELRDDEYADRLIKDLEVYFSQMQKEFWDFIPPRWREAHMEVVVFSGAQAFDDYASRDGGLPRGEKGYSSAREPRIVFLRQAVYYRDVMIAVHEMTHVFNRFCADSTPLWLDEGMAQFYANYAGEASGNTGLSSGVNPEALVIMDGAVRRGAFVPFTEVMQMSEALFYAEGSELNYAEAWALVYWMRRGMPDGDVMFTSFYDAVARGRDGLIAFSENYGHNHQLVSSMLMDCLQRLYKAHVAKPLQPEVGNDKPADAR